MNKIKYDVRLKDGTRFTGKMWAEAWRRFADGLSSRNDTLLYLEDCVFVCKSQIAWVRYRRVL